MRDHRDEEAHEKPASASTASISASQKRLLADPKKPKRASSSSAAASSDSSLSSDSSTDRFRKKTRFCPNLSDCHGCGVRINYTNPLDRLQTLDSFWRIVLLCKKCIKRIKSAQVCSYCFAETAGNDCLQCRDCNRRIHKDCVLKNRYSAPWSYCCSVSAFSVCVDCWIPKLLINTNRVCKRRRNKRILSEGCSLGDSRVLVDNDDSRVLVDNCDSRVLVDNGDPKSLQDVVNDANCAVEKKVLAATQAKETALTRSVVAERAMELVNGALDLMKHRDENGVKNGSIVSSIGSSATSSVPAVDDAALAFQLHRVMNSSPRISRNLCSLNSKCLVVPKIRKSDSSGDISAIKIAENLNGTISEPSVCNRASDDGSQTELDYSKLGGVIDERTSNLAENLNLGPIGNCKCGNERGMNSESLSCQKQVELGQELQSSNARTQSRFKYNGDNMMLYSRRRKKTRDRYLIKYTKRPVGSKVVSNRKTKFLYDSFHVESKTITSGASMNHCSESKTFSDALFQSCAVVVQASPCGPDSPQDHS